MIQNLEICITFHRSHGWCCCRKRPEVILGFMYVINMFHYIKQYYILALLFSFLFNFLHLLFFARESDNLVTHRHCTNVPLLSQLCKFVPNTSSSFIRPWVDSKYLVAKSYVLLNRNLVLFPTEFNHVSIVYPYVNRRHMTMQILTE